MIRHNGKDILTGPADPLLERLPSAGGKTVNDALDRFLTERAGETRGEGRGSGMRRSLRSVYSAATRKPRPREAAPQSADEMMGRTKPVSGPIRVILPQPSPLPALSTPSTPMKKPTTATSDPQLKVIGQRIREARIAAGWNFFGAAAALARRLGFGPSKLGVLEGGFGFAGRKEVERFLQINPDWVETGKGEMFLGTPPEPTVTEKIVRTGRKKDEPAPKAATYPPGSVGAAVEEAVEPPAPRPIKGPAHLIPRFLADLAIEKAALIARRESLDAAIAALEKVEALYPAAR